MKLITAILTKFNENGDLILDEEYSRFLKQLHINGVNAFFVGGTNGEFHTMNFDERKRLLEFVFNEFNGKVEIIAHIGGNRFNDTIKLGEFALSLGVKKLAIVAPYYFKYDGKAIEDYFITVANRLLKAEILLYNIPRFTGNRIEFNNIVRIKENAQNVIGLKDTDDRPWIVRKLKEELGNDFQIFGGNDLLMVDYLMRGADGQVSGTSNVFPKILRKIMDEFERGNIKEALKLQGILHEMVENVANHRSFIGANKYALKILGYDLGFPRLPTRYLTENEKEDLKRFVEKFSKWGI